MFLNLKFLKSRKNIELSQKVLFKSKQLLSEKEIFFYKIYFLGFIEDDIKRFILY